MQREQDFNPVPSSCKVMVPSASLSSSPKRRIIKFKTTGIGTSCAARGFKFILWRMLRKWKKTHLFKDVLPFSFLTVGSNNCRVCVNSLLWSKHGSHSWLIWCSSLMPLWQFSCLNTVYCRHAHRWQHRSRKPSQNSLIPLIWMLSVGKLLNFCMSRATIDPKCSFWDWFKRVGIFLRGEHKYSLLMRK